MARYIEDSCRVCRREGEKLFLKGSRCYTDKCAMARRAYAPGQHGQRRAKLSEYGIQLQEKQKVRFTYGLSEKQFRNLFDKAGKMAGKHGDNFLILLETRLDNLVYRMGFASTRRQARQLVNHQHILVDGKKCDIPSYLVKPGQTIAVKETSKGIAFIHEAIDQNFARKEYVSVDNEKLEGKFVRLPERSEVLPEIKENLIVEFYNR